MTSIQHLIVVHILLEGFEEVAVLLPQAYRLVAQIDDKPSWKQLRWAEGLLVGRQGDPDGAERLLLEAHRGFAEIGEIGMRAIVALDLALLYDDQKRSLDALRRAAEALPALEALQLPEALRCLELLRDSLARQTLQRGLVESARRRLFCPAAPF